MDKADFVRQLGEIAETLRPLTRSANPGALTWDGNQYVKGQQVSPDPYALAWFSTVTTMASLLDGQECPLSVAQIACIDRTLFGGGGSLNDLTFGPDSVGNTAETINRRLDEKRRALWRCFHSD